MNKLPKTFNRWMVLLVVIIISIVLTVVLTGNKNGKAPKAPVANVPTNNVAAITPVVTTPVQVKLTVDVTGGFVDVFVTNSSVVEHGELLFKLSGNTRYTKIEEDSLFEKYFTANETDKNTGTRSLRVGASKGIEGVALNPGENQKFARIYFSSLTNNSVTVDEANSSFFVGTGNPVYKVVVVK